jgi:hypothetical protein
MLRKKVYASITMYDIRLREVGCFDAYTCDSSLSVNISQYAYALEAVCFVGSTMFHTVSYGTVVGCL